MVKKTFFLLLCVSLLALLAGPYDKASAWLIGPCNQMSEFHPATSSLVGWFWCSPGPGAAPATITIPVPSITGHSPNLAFVGIPYAFSVSWDPSSLTNAGYDDTMKGNASGRTTVEFGSTRYIGLRSYVQVKADISEIIINGITYTDNRELKVTPESLSFITLFPNGWWANDRKFYGPNLENYIPLSNGGIVKKANNCSDTQECGRNASDIKGDFPKAMFSFGQYPNLPNSDDKNAWYYFVSGISSNYAGNSDGAHGEPAIHIEVNSYWSIWAKLAWDSIEIPKSFKVHDYDYYCGPDLDKDGVGDLICEAYHYETHWVYAGGAGSTDYEQVVAPFTQQLVSATDNPRGQLATYYPVEIFQSQPLLEVPLW